MQEIYFYLDDSGVLHPNSNEQFFVYAGYVFLSHKEKDSALCSYRKASRKVNPTPGTELKAHGAKGKTKRYLNSILKDYESLSCVVDKHRVYTNIIKYDVIIIQKSSTITSTTPKFCYHNFYCFFTNHMLS